MVNNFIINCFKACDSFAICLRKFNRLGLTTTQAVKIFFNKVVNDDGIPFDLKINEEEQIDWNNLNEETKKAILDTEENNPSKKFNTVEEMFNDMGIYVRD